MPEPVTTTENPTPGAPAPAPAATTTSPAPAPAAATPPSSATTAPPAEDRSTWIPPHRLREETEKRQKYEADLRASQQRIQEYENKLRVALGVQEPDNDAAKREKIKKEFYELFPDQKEVPSFIAEQKAHRERESRRYAEQQFSTVFSEVAEHMSVDELSAEQQDDLREHFRGWFNQRVQTELRASGDTESQTLERWEAGDKKLLSEFVTRYMKNWFEPLKRTASAPAIQQATKRVPNSTGRSQVTSVQKPAEFKTLDERLDYAAKLAKERGVQFGG